MSYFRWGAIFTVSVMLGRAAASSQRRCRFVSPPRKGSSEKAGASQSSDTAKRSCLRGFRTACSCFYILPDG
jgi:hypothetical protein